MSGGEAWQAALAYLCEEKGFVANKVLAGKEFHDFKPTVDGGAVWVFQAADLRYGGWTDQTALLTEEQYTGFLLRASGGKAPL